MPRSATPDFGGRAETRPRVAGGAVAGGEGVTSAAKRLFRILTVRPDAKGVRCGPGLQSLGQPSLAPAPQFMRCSLSRIVSPLPSAWPSSGGWRKSTPRCGAIGVSENAPAGPGSQSDWRHAPGQRRAARESRSRERRRAGRRNFPNRPAGRGEKGAGMMITSVAGTTGVPVDSRHSAPTFSAPAE